MKCSFRLSSLGDLACRKSFFHFSRESCSPSRLSITVCAFKMATQSKVHETVSWQMNTRASIYSQQRRIHSTTFTFSSRFLFFLSVFFAALLCCLAWRYRGAAPFYWVCCVHGVHVTVHSTATTTRPQILFENLNWQAGWDWICDRVAFSYTLALNSSF